MPQQSVRWHCAIVAIQNFNINGLLKGRWIGNQYNPMAEISRWSVVIAAHATDSHIHTPYKPLYIHNSVQSSLLFMLLATPLAIHIWIREYIES